MQIDLHIDASELLLSLPRGVNRLAYAVANAVNDTAKLIQKTIQDETLHGGAFEVRKADFIRRQVAIIKPFASPTQGRPYAEISVGQKPGLLLSEFEAGGLKPKRASSIAVPLTGSAARPEFGQSVPQELYYRKLQISSTTRKGRQGTYLVPGVGIFQRKLGEKVSREIYAFESDAKLKPDLHFYETAGRVADQWFPVYMENQVQKELVRAGLA